MTVRQLLAAAAIVGVLVPSVGACSDDDATTCKDFQRKDQAGKVAAVKASLQNGDKYTQAQLADMAKVYDQACSVKKYQDKTIKDLSGETKQVWEDLKRSAPSLPPLPTPA